MFLNNSSWIGNLHQFAILSHLTHIAISLKILYKNTRQAVFLHQECNRSQQKHDLTLSFVCSFGTARHLSQINPESRAHCLAVVFRENSKSGFFFCHNNYREKPSQCLFFLFIFFPGISERRGETSPGGAAQGRRGAPAAGEREERQRGQGGSTEGQKGQGEGHSNRSTKVGSNRRTVKGPVFSSNCSQVQMTFSSVY